MTRTKPAARRGEAGSAYRLAKRKKREAGAVSLTSKLLHDPSKKQKKLRKNQGAPLPSEAVADHVEDSENGAAPGKPDNKRAPDGDFQQPLKKAKKGSFSHAEKSGAGAGTQSYSAEIEASTSLKPSNDTEVVIDPKILEILTSTYAITNMSIISSSKIQQKVTKVLETLGSFSFTGPAKPNIVLIHAKASVAQKLITVVELATREIAKSGGKYYQYNRLDRIVVEQERKPAKEADLTILGRKVELDPEAMGIGEDDTPEESAFETMKLPNERAVEGKPMKRVIPGMTVWLSRVRIDSLRNAYREQTNDVK